jgi:hypothetical protein
MLEFVGNEMVAQLEGAVVFSESMGLDVNKAQIYMMMCGQKAWYDDFSVRAATLNPNWPAHKRMLLGTP